MSEKGWEERGPKAHLKSSDFGTPWFRYSLVAFQLLWISKTERVREPSSRLLPKSLRTPLCYGLPESLPSQEVNPTDQIKGQKKHIKVFNINFLSPCQTPHVPEGPKIEKIRDFERDWKFRARMKFSSAPPTAALFFVGKSRHRDWNFRARLNISIEIENFERDWIFSIVGPSGFGPSEKEFMCLISWEFHSGTAFAQRFSWSAAHSLTSFL